VFRIVHVGHREVVVVATLKFYGDESADATKSRAFAVAAVLGTEDEWADAMRGWLRRTRGLPFHANKCESEFVRDPDTDKHKENLRLYKDLTIILAESWLTWCFLLAGLAESRRVDAWS
jgi:hypothetical protein